MTVTEKLWAFRLPEVSIAVYVTMVVPTAKYPPGAAVPTKLISSQLSVAVGMSHVAVAPQSSTSAFKTRLLGMFVMVGDSVSGEH